MRLALLFTLAAVSALAQEPLRQQIRAYPSRQMPSILTGSCGDRECISELVEWAKPEFEGGRFYGAAVNEVLSDAPTDQVRASGRR